ncbi:MAG: ion transporter [Bacteroidetes bacterium]|nr:MAG: ion transporter [Bacteroidota bacterium]REK03528.1 MAG: ion transporter [Bacteroidota bacterium]REK34831.1 MAG: ion transporter [Bacteroidota bacterium]REK51202.1 MAG: ion transporter [Bacteroidota bacterium]
MNSRLKAKYYTIIFGHETKAGRRFDVILLWVIIASIILVMLDSIESIRLKYGSLLFYAELGFTLIFSLEYIARIWVSPRPLRYIFSFYGIIDLLSIIPTYFSLFFHPAHYMLTLRTLRLLRVFRILKLSRYLSEAEYIADALRSSKRKILVFIFAVLNIVIIVGTIMYIVEGDNSGFKNIPQSIYWAIVTITTVGFGDIVPQTAIGQFISSLLMMTGYAIIAVPTGIVTAEMAIGYNNKKKSKQCNNCSEVNEISANYCQHCGSKF